MATRSYNGQLYQSATSELRFSTPDGFDFRFQTWEDAKLRIGRKKKINNKADGTISGWTSENVSTDASLKCRKDEWDQFVDAIQQFYPGAEIDTILFTETVSYGNSLQKIRTDKAEVLLQDINRDLPKSQDPLMVDMPLAMLSFVENGIPRFVSVI